MPEIVETEVVELGRPTAVFHAVRMLWSGQTRPRPSGRSSAGPGPAFALARSRASAGADVWTTVSLPKSAKEAAEVLRAHRGFRAVLPTLMRGSCKPNPSGDAKTSTPRSGPFGVTLVRYPIPRSNAAVNCSSSESSRRVPWSLMSSCACLSCSRSCAGLSRRGYNSRASPSRFGSGRRRMPGRPQKVHRNTVAKDISGSPTARRSCHRDLAEFQER